MKSFAGRITAILLSALIIVSAVSPAASALYGVANPYIGYYKGSQEFFGHRVIPTGVYIGGASGASSQTLANNLIRELREWRNSTDRHYLVGSAFIIDTMLGRGSSGSGYSTAATRNTMGADIDRLERQLNKFISDGGRITYEWYSYSSNSFMQSANTDVAWNNDLGTRPSYVFSRGGTIYYVLKEECANPLDGIMRTFPDPSDWSVSGRSYVSKNASSINGSSIVASVGETVYWRHTLRNTGPDAMDQDVSYSVPKTGGFTGAGMNNSNPTGSARGRSGSTFVTINGTGPARYTIQPGDAGKLLCEYIRWDPSSSSNGNAARSSEACVRVMYAGDVSGDLRFDPDDTVLDDGTSLTAHFMATNTASIEATVSLDGYVWYDRNNNDSFDGGETKLFNRDGTGTLPTNPNTTEIARHTETVDITRGGRICGFWRVTSTNPLIATNGTAKTACAYVGFSPRLQTWGGDIRVGSAPTSSANVASLMRARASTVNSGGISYSGSWSEYGLFAPRAAVVKTSIEGVASAAGLAENSPVASLNQANWSALTFGNKFSGTYPATQACVYGCFATPSAMGQFPEIEAYLQRYGLVDGDKIKAVSGTYTINGNIDDDGSGRPIIIIADNIAIKGDVTKLDAWLIARDSVNTCTDGGVSPMKVGDCDKTLRINGPVIAKTLLARRIGDPIADKKTVGEVVSLRGDAYIWAYKTTHSISSPFKTTGTKELPPRY